MIYVLIDTNYFVAKQYRVDTDEMKRFKELTEINRVQFVYNTVLIEEYKSNITTMENRMLAALKKFYNSGHSVKDYFKQNKMEIEIDVIISDFKKSISSKHRDQFLTFVSQLKGTDIGLVESEKIFEKYFSLEPPFEERKKTEFPDAAIIFSLEKWINLSCDKGDEVYVVTRDEGFKKGIENLDMRNMDIQVTEDLIPIFNIFTEIDVSRIFKSEEGTIKDYFQSYMEEDLLLCIKEDHISEYEIIVNNYSNDEEVNDLDITDIYIDELNFIEASYDESGKFFLIVLKADVYGRILVKYTYDDYENAYYDSEIKEYLFVETVNGECEDDFNLDFYVHLKVSQKTLKKLAFDEEIEYEDFEEIVILNEKNKIEIYSNDWHY